MLRASRKFIFDQPCQNGTDARLPESLLQSLRARPEIDFADGRMQSHASLTKGDEHRWFDTIGVNPVLDDQLRPKNYISGHALTGKSDEPWLLIGGVADMMNLHAGDSVAYSADGETIRNIIVTGIIRRPSIELIAKPTIYLDLRKLFAADLHATPEYDVIDLKLKDSANITDYDAYSKALQDQLGPTVKVNPGTNSKAKLADQTRSIQLLLSLLSTISGICAAALIIGTTLSVGVQER